MAGKSPSPARPLAAKAPPPPDWFDQEAPPGAAMKKLVRRLLWRGRASWPIWVAAAVIASGAFTAFKMLRPPTFEVTVVIHVSEGQVTHAGAMLGRRKLRAYVDDLAFTYPRLVELMTKHARRFPRVKTDPVFAVQGFRENLTVEITANDFVEERHLDDPPQTARVVITFKAGDPELTYEIAQELAAMVAGSTVAGQKAVLEADLQTATAEASSAADAVTAAERRAQPGAPNPELEQARQRLLSVQQRVADATVALKALGQEQGLRFDIVDPGRVPRRPNPVVLAAKAFAVTLVLALLALWLLAGAFDPRVLDEVDVADTGMPVLGRLPSAAPVSPRADVDRQPVKEKDGVAEDAQQGGAPDSRV